MTRDEEEDEAVIVSRHGGESSSLLSHKRPVALLLEDDGDDNTLGEKKKQRVLEPSSPILSVFEMPRMSHTLLDEPLPYNQQVMMDDGSLSDGCFEEEEEMEQVTREKEILIKEDTDPEGMDPVERFTWDDVTASRCAIQNRLSGRIVHELVRLDDQYGTLSCALERTVKERKSGSILLVGPRGSGKSSLVKQVLEETGKAHSKPGQKAFFEIHLNGLIQNDDKVALREIVRQLHLESQLQAQKLNSFAECLSFILAALKNVSMAPVIFVMEELDLFAQHPKQSLLYNLFDLTQTSGTPIFVLGITSKMDVMEYLEKRVKSRFSHQCIYFYPPDALDNFIQTAKGCCFLQPGDGMQSTKYRTAFNKAVESAFKQPKVRAVAQRIFDLNRDVRVWKSLVLSAFSSLSEQVPFPCAEDIIRASNSFFVDHKAKLVANLSVLEVCLFTAVKHILYRQGDEDAFNFEMVFDEYREFTKGVSTFGRSVNVFFTKPVAHKAFERLIELELVKYLDGHPGKGTKEHRMMKSMMTRDEIQDAVMEFARELPDAVMKWAES